MKPSICVLPWFLACNSTLPLLLGEGERMDGHTALSMFIYTYMCSEEVHLCILVKHGIPKSTCWGFSLAF